MVQVAETELWNGTTWTEVNDLNTTPVGSNAGAGIATDALNLGPTAASETWDGSSWTSIASANTGRSNARGNGDSSSFLAVGGDNPPGPVAACESWNGTSWTEVADLATGRYEVGTSCLAPTNSTVAFGGGSSTDNGYTLTEEFTAADFQIKTVTTS